MGGAVSIDNTPYDETKFLQSKAIMESTADDAEKFSKLKSIWTDDGHHKSVKEPEVGAAHEEHKEEAHKEETHNGEVHKDEHHEKHHCNKEEHHHREGDSHHKEGITMLTRRRSTTTKSRTTKRRASITSTREEKITRKAPKDSPKAPSGSASTGKLPSASSEHLSEKVSKEV
ncbi:hypothetical protein GQ600_18218 [Phytophthora cactorum]|nr:hypothetical protein GQ600_18218 [Phytophthora cactorum]